MAYEIAKRYLVCIIRRFTRYLRANNINNVISITYDHELNTIHVYSISPLIVNLCAKNLMSLFELSYACEASTTIFDSRVRIDNMYCVKSRILSSQIYSIKINLEFETINDSLLQITCKRLVAIMYNPDLLPLDLIDKLADSDPIIAIKYIL
ncbi:hypothetical protein F-VV10_0270 [Faustovirus]|nr:hypothetical protein F-VV10_0270 [Faustovirus]